MSKTKTHSRQPDSPRTVSALAPWLQQQFQTLSKAIKEIRDSHAEDLARAMLITGNGDGFEPAIRAAIRDYCHVRQERAAFSARRDLPEQVRNDVVAAFQRLVTDRLHDLRLLDVTVHEVDPGTPLDVTRHQVIQRLETDDEVQLNTVCSCITPVFTWTSPHGTDRIEPACVVAYTALQAAKPTDDDACSPEDGSNSELSSETDTLFPTSPHS